MHCSLSVFIYALILIDRAQEYQVDFRVNSRNLHRLLISAHMVAAKYLDDRYFKNSYYAGVGGVSVSAINLLELEFLTLINFNAHVS